MTEDPRLREQFEEWWGSRVVKTETAPMSINEIAFHAFRAGALLEEQPDD